MPPVRFDHLSSPTVPLRRLVARRPWIQWLLICALAAVIGSSVQTQLSAVDAARDSWGITVPVLVATDTIEVGQPLQLRTRQVPLALVPASALDPANEPGTEAIARQRLAVGEIVTDFDVVAGDRPQAMIPAGWLAVPVVEAPPSGAEIGDRVQVASDGIVVSDDALVVGRSDQVTLLAVPAAEAALLPAASNAGSLTLLLEP